MTQHEAKAHNPYDHQEVWELLPWYVNGTLHDQERTSVEGHLALCSACQEELTRCQALANLVRTAEEETWAPSPAHFAQLMARIDATPGPPAPGQRWRTWCKGRYEACRALLQETPALVRRALAAQGALVVVLVSVLAWHMGQTPEQEYRTLTTEARPHEPQRQVQFRVVFADDMTAKDLRTLLTRVQGTIIAGPSSLGVYTIQVTLTSATPGHVESVMVQLREHRQVRLAELLTVP